jgi:hypothetical protein
MLQEIVDAIISELREIFGELDPHVEIESFRKLDLPNKHLYHIYYGKKIQSSIDFYEDVVILKTLTQNLEIPLADPNSIDKIIDILKDDLPKWKYACDWAL